MMNALRLAFYELRRFRTPTQRIALGLLIALPVVFGVVYLAAAWDPQSRLTNVPVAIVNADRPVEVGDTTVRGGQQLVDSLTGTDTFDWQLTDAETAARGLAAGDYYLTITVPADFSAKLATGPNRAPTRPTVILRRDDANAPGVAALVDRVRGDLKQHVDNAATTTYYESVFGDVDALRTHATKARDTSADLRGNIDAAGNASTELVNGLRDTTEASRDLVERIDQLRSESATGVDTTADLAATAAELTDTDSALLDDVLPAIPAVADSAEEVADLSADVESLLSDDSELADSTEQVTEQLVALAEDHPELTEDPAYAAVLDTADRAATGVEDAAELAGSLEDSASTLATTTGDLSDTAGSVGQDVADRAADLDSLASTASAAADRAAGVDDELAAVGEDAASIADGAGSATGVAQRVNERFQAFRGGVDGIVENLRSVAEQVPAPAGDRQSGNATLVGSPTTIRSVADHDAKVEGTGLAPFLFAIALWMLGILAFLLIRPITGRALAGRIKAPPIVVAGWLPAFAVALTGGLLLFLTSLVIGLRPANPLAVLAAIIVGAGAFSAMSHLLRTWLGTVGTVVAVALLLPQVVAAAPIYPKETLPRLLELIHPILPMTHLVTALRIAVNGGPAGRLWPGLLILLGFAAAALAATTVVVMRHRRWTPGRLHPMFAWPEPARG